MKLEQHLVNYAHYHRDKRNIFTHFIGVPLIVFAVIGLLYIPVASFSSIVLTPAHLVMLLSILFYIRLDLKLGIVMSGFLLCGLLLVLQLYTMVGSPSAFYFGFLAVFIVGWIIQFIGHIFEGKKPAFVDDLMGLLIGPLFVLVELLFKFGVYKSLEAQLVDKAGPYR